MRYFTYFRIKRLINKLAWKYIFSRNFKYFGKHSNILAPDLINGEQYITIEDDVFINLRATLLAVKVSDNEPHLIIGKGAKIRTSFHAVCASSIVIGSNVLIADNVLVTDNTHTYTDINTPISNQSIEILSDVKIGENAWLGRNVCVIGASVGKHSIIGANSVVLQSVPDYSVAVGIPAVVIKQYDFDSKRWIKCNKQTEEEF